MFDDFQIEARFQPFHSTHVASIAKLLDVANNEFCIENDQNKEAELILIILIEEVVLSAEH